MTSIKDILKGTEYENLSRFSEEDKEWINGRIQMRADGKPGIELLCGGGMKKGIFLN